MKKMISSPYKNFFLLVDIVVAVIAFYVWVSYIFDGFNTIDLTKESVFFTMVFTAFLIVTIHSIFKLKNVHVDDNYLYVNDFFKNDKIPLTNVKSVGETFGPRKTIIIDFKNETMFGKKISFCAAFVWWGLFKSHPIVEELKRKYQE